MNIGNGEQWGRAPSGAFGDGGDGAAFERGGDIIVAVVVGAAESEEQIAGGEGARIHAPAGDGFLAGPGDAEHGGDLVKVKCIMGGA